MTPSTNSSSNGDDYQRIGYRFLQTLGVVAGGADRHRCFTSNVRLTPYFLDTRNLIVPRQISVELGLMMLPMVSSRHR